MRMKTVGSLRGVELRFIKLLAAMGLPMFSQFVVVVLLFFVVASFSRVMDGWALFACYIVLCAFVGLFQLLAATCIARTFHSENFLRKTMVFVFALVFILGFYPPSGAFFAGSVFQMTSSGSRNCVVLSWMKENPEVSRELRFLDGGGNSNQSVPLRIFIEVDGYYVVRKYEKDKKDEPVYFIPRALVSGMKVCPSDTTPASQSS